MRNLSMKPLLPLGLGVLACVHVARSQNSADLLGSATPAGPQAPTTVTNCSFLRSPLAHAIGGGNADRVTHLLTNGLGANCVFTDLWQGKTPLMVAVSSYYAPNIAVVKALLENGADPNLAGRDGVTPLMIAAGGTQTGAVEALLEHGALLDMTNHWGETALIRAARDGSEEVVKLLLEAGADLHASDSSGWTALGYAMDRRSPGIVKILRDAGASDRGPGYVANAIFWKVSPILFLLLTNESVKVAIVNCMTTSITNSLAGLWLVQDPATRELIPAAMGITDNLGRLLEVGANANTILTNGVTLLALASASGNEEAVGTLIEKGVDVDSADSSGMTSLAYACQINHIGIVETLLAAGADPNCRDSSGHSAMAHARERGYTELVEILRNAGARD